jgi:Cu2+-exporting ATPase
MFAKKFWVSLILTILVVLYSELPIAAGALAFKEILLHPALAALFMSISTVVVAINAILLRRIKIEKI